MRDIIDAWKATALFLMHPTIVIGSVAGVLLWWWLSTVFHHPTRDEEEK